VGERASFVSPSVETGKIGLGRLLWSMASPVEADFRLRYAFEGVGQGPDGELQRRVDGEQGERHRSSQLYFRRTGKAK
jgi:hypothetical protein